MNGYSAFGLNPSEEQMEIIDWEMATWYVAPNEEGASYAEYPEVKKDIGVCGYSLPFTSEPAVNPAYT